MSARKTIFVISTLSVISLAAIGCKPIAKKDGQAGDTTLTSASIPKGGSCNEVAAKTCTEYQDNTLGLSEGMCKDLIKGDYKKDAGCPNAELMGTCERKTTKEFFYFGGNYPWVADAKDYCEKEGIQSAGKWTSQPGAEETAKQNALPTAATIKGSCVSLGGTCEDLHGPDFESRKSTCTQFDGKFSDSPCSTEKLVGSCVKGGKTERLYEKDLKFQKLADLQSSCEKYGIPFGHWYPNPAYEPKAAAAPKAAGPKKAKKAKPAPEKKDE